MTSGGVVSHPLGADFQTLGDFVNIEKILPNLLGVGHDLQICRHRNSRDRSIVRDSLTRSKARIDARVLFSPCANFRQTASTASIRLDMSKALVASNPLWWYVLAPSTTNCKGPSTMHHPKCIRSRSFPSLRNSES